MTSKLLYRAAHEDTEYEAYLKDARAPEQKLWHPGEVNHRTAGGNVIVRPQSTSLISFEQYLADRLREWMELNKRELRRLGLKGLPVPLLMGGAGAGAYSFTNNSRTHIIDGTYSIGTNSFKMALFQSASNIGVTSDTYAGLTSEVANSNGYTTGGVSITLSLSGTTTVTVAITDASWTASGGSIVARFAVNYRTSSDVLAYCLLDSTPADVTIFSGNTFTVSGSNNLFTYS